MSKSMLEYLASLRAHGCTPQNIGDVTIGRTVYAAGSFTGIAGISSDRPARQTRIALMPMYRTDWVTRDSAGPTPVLLPASYRRSRNTVYGVMWYISGWNPAENVLWLDLAGEYFPTHRRVPISIHWAESFETSLRLASPEVLARIEGK